jgi:hypothetical protein
MPRPFGRLAATKEEVRRAQEVDQGRAADHEVDGGDLLEQGVAGGRGGGTFRGMSASAGRAKWVSKHAVTRTASSCLARSAGRPPVRRADRVDSSASRSRPRHVRMPNGSSSKDSASR